MHPPSKEKNNITYRNFGYYGIVRYYGMIVFLVCDVLLLTGNQDNYFYTLP